MIRKQYFFHIHSLCCNTPIQFSFLQSWDICAAAEPIMLSLLCEDSYAIKILQKRGEKTLQTVLAIDYSVTLLTHAMVGRNTNVEAFQYSQKIGVNILTRS